MRILIASEHGKVVGGIETYLRACVRQLSARDHQLGFYFSAPESGIGESVVGSNAGPIWRGASDQSTVKEIRQWGPDVVYSHGLLDPAKEAKLIDSFKTVSFSHCYGATCVSLTKRRRLPIASICTRPLGPGCLACYFPRRCGGLNPVTAIRMYRRERSRQTLLPKYFAILAASQHMVEELIRNGARSDRVHHLPLFPSDSNADRQSPYPRARSDRVLFVGRVTESKGWRELVRAMPQASSRLGRKLTLVVAGDGPDANALRDEVVKRQVPAEFLGWIEPERRNAEMRAADVLAVPSVWPEPFGLVGIEAGCVGTPAVAFAVGGITDWLIPGVSGELASGVRPNARAFADALVRALQCEEHLHRLRVGAWETAHRFTPEAHMNRLIPILEAAANS